MQLTEVRVNLCGQTAGRLKAFCSLTFDDTFVVRDVKLIEGPDGLFLAMPSRKLCDHCPRCGEKNHLRARFCNNCGSRLDENRHLHNHAGPGRKQSGRPRGEMPRTPAHDGLVGRRGDLEGPGCTHRSRVRPTGGNRKGAAGH